MADETDNLTPLLTELAKYGVGSAGTAGANAAVQAAYQAIIKNLQDRFNDYDNLQAPTYNNITAQQLGPSALSGITPDAQARIDEQAAIAQLDDIAKSGGLTLVDRQALNRLEQQLSRGNSARNAGLANQYAARGQLGSGAQLAMSLANQQSAAQNANDRGEGIAAQAQQRAMQAILNKGSQSRAMSNDDYARKKAAAEAADSIAKYNASMRTDANKYNNTLAGQSYDDQLKKLLGENTVTKSLNDALLGTGTQNANAIAAQTGDTNALIGALGSSATSLAKAAKGAFGSGSGGGSGGGDTNPDVTGDRGGASDLTGGHTDTEDTYTTPPASDPSEWENPYY